MADWNSEQYLKFDQDVFNRVMQEYPIQKNGSIILAVARNNLDTICFPIDTHKYFDFRGSADWSNYQPKFTMTMFMCL